MSEGMLVRLFQSGVRVSLLVNIELPNCRTRGKSKDPLGYTFQHPIQIAECCRSVGNIRWYAGEIVPIGAKVSLEVSTELPPIVVPGKV